MKNPLNTALPLAEALGHTLVKVHWGKRAVVRIFRNKDATITRASLAAHRSDRSSRLVPVKRPEK